MAQLHEYQGKQLLAAQGITIPAGRVARCAEEARAIALEIGGAVVVKAQVHSTSRAAQGGVRFAETPEEAARLQSEISHLIFSNATPDAILIEEKQSIAREFYLGYIIDDALKRPCLLFSATGGSGIEERAATMARFVCSVLREPTPEELQPVLQQADAPVELLAALSAKLIKLYRVAKSCEARTAEINPLAQLADGRIMALDSRVSVDDYAVFRHQDLGIAVARELGHTPTKLERIAWAIEAHDFRGTFFFVEIAGSGQPAAGSDAAEVAGKQQTAGSDPNDLTSKTTQPPDTACCRLPAAGLLIGFHGAGGGGSMASLDAALRAGLQPADYVDTSGNPPGSKVYRAVRIILSIPGIQGYFLSGSGVASQEQFGLARAIVKAFREVRPTIPAVLRLGGNGEDLANDIIHNYLADMPAPVEAYKKNDSADFCANRLRELIEDNRSVPEAVATGYEDGGSAPRSNPGATASGTDLNARNLYSFEIRTGRITFDHALCAKCETKECVKVCPPQILNAENGLPVLNITRAEAQRGKCTECLACEVECWFHGAGGAKIDLPIDGIDRMDRISQD